MKKLLIMLTSVLLVLAFSDNAFAQKAKTDATITVTLTDAMTGDPVGFATVQLIIPGEDKAYKYALSDGDGVAKFEKLKAGTYNLKAEMMGYMAYTKEIQLEASQNLNLGEAKMEPDQKVLDAAKVSAVGNTVIVKKDTIEYNATAFKTTENDVLEDLLKKLPGVIVGDDGSITVNGQTITQVYIDGKTFFLNDPNLATKNIPAKIVEKVKVVQKKSDQAEFTGIDDGQETTVLDLTVQQGMMNGLIGNAQLGGGHDLPAQASAYDDYRFQSNVFLGNFKSDTQLSIIANANNANNQRFGGGGGGMGGGMMGGRGGRGGGGMFTIESRKTHKESVRTVCLEHGKKEPRPSVEYTIVPIDQYTDNKTTQVLCAMLGDEEVNQNALQAAVWNTENGLSFDELAAKTKQEGANNPVTSYFQTAELSVGAELLEKAAERAQVLQEVEDAQEDLRNYAPEKTDDTVENLTNEVLK